MSNVYLKNSKYLSAYGFACGFVQKATETGNLYEGGKRLNLWKEGGLYNVSYMDDDKIICRRMYTNLANARLDYNAMKKVCELKSVSKNGE